MYFHVFYCCVSVRAGCLLVLYTLVIFRQCLSLNLILAVEWGLMDSKLPGPTCFCHNPHPPVLELQPRVAMPRFYMGDLNSDRLASTASTHTHRTTLSKTSYFSFGFWNSYLPTGDFEILLSHPLEWQGNYVWFLKVEHQIQDFKQSGQMFYQLNHPGPTLPLDPDNLSCLISVPAAPAGSTLRTFSMLTNIQYCMPA